MGTIFGHVVSHVLQMQFEPEKELLSFRYTPIKGYTSSTRSWISLTCPIDVSDYLFCAFKQPTHLFSFVRSNVKNSVFQNHQRCMPAKLGIRWELPCSLLFKHLGTTSSGQSYPTRRSRCCMSWVHWNDAQSNFRNSFN